MLIPAINAETFEEIKNKLDLIKPYSDWVHLDVADSTFTENTLWHSASDLVEIGGSFNFEIHLMINDVDEKIDEWLFLPSVKRIVFHLSTSKDPDFVIRKCKENGKEVGISISPKESVEAALKYKDNVDFFQILGVIPGLPGQKISEETFGRIKQVRNSCPSCIIEIDGGMNVDTIPKAMKFGANRIVSASAIFNGENIKDNFERLNKLWLI